MRNGSLKSVISFVVCGIMMALVTIATNLFTHQSHGVVYAEELTTYTSVDGKYTVSDTGVLTAYNGSEDMPSIPTKISVDTSSPSDGVADAEITVTAIGAGAFSGNTTITDVTLPSSVTHILSADTSNNGAFSGCTNLISVVTEDGALTSIGDYAFYGCTMFDAISSGNFVLDMSKVTTIGMSAFEGCSISQNIKLDSIETIGYKAFADSENTEIQIASDLQNIKYYSSNYPTPVNIETVSGDGEIIASGKIYTNNEKVLKYLQNIGYTNYSSMNINITGTDSAMIGEDITLNFAYSEAVETMKLYRDSELLTDSFTASYTDKVNTTGKYIYKVEVTDIFGDTFEKTYTVVVLATDDFKDYTVVDGVLVKYNGTETVVTIPEYVDATYEYGHITSIGAGAFSGNTAITSVTLASSIDTIEDASYSTEGAFYGCTNLKTVISTNDALKNIGKYTFFGCVNLETINASGLVNIYDNAFLQCERLKTIGNVEGECNLTSLEYAGANIFIETAISGKIVLTSINKIGVSAFVNNGIEYLYIPENNDITYISDEYPSGVAIENAENGMFADNGRVYTQNEKVIAFLNRIGHTYITTTASFECADEMVVQGESITIGNIVTTGDIASSKWYVNGVETAISQDNKITLNTLGENVITLKVVDKFGSEVSATSTHIVRVVETDDYKYFVVEDGVLISYTGSDTEVVVPNYLDENLGYGQITTIGKGAFSDNSIIEKVTLSSGITAIENGVNNAGAFSNCYSLVEVVSENNALSVIGDYAFINSNMLEKVTASNVVTIGKYAFSGCASLNTIGVVENTIGLDSITTIGVGAFMNNTFTGVVLKNVEVIGEYAFLSDSNYLNYLAIGNKENIVVLNEYNMRTAINESTSLIAKSTTKIYSVNEKVLAYATKNELTYETLSVSITSDKEELVKGGNVTFSSTITGLDIIYAWMNGGVSISGATSETYVDSSATATTKEISLKVTDVMGNEKVSNVIKVRYYSDNTYTLFEISEDGVLIKYHGTATNVIVPEYLDKDINDGRITSIGNGAFRENVTLVSVTLPASVTRIESATNASQGAFYGCGSLSQIIITNALVYVGDYACYGCNSLFRFGVSSDNNNFEYLTYVGISAFEGTNVTDVVLQNVITIGENAFVDIGSGEYVIIDSNSSAIKVKTASEEIGVASAEVRFTDKVIYTNNENVVTYATSNEYEYLTTSVVITGADKAVINEDVVLQANVVGVVESSSWTKGGVVIASNTSTVTVTSDVKGQVTYTYTITDMLGDTYSVDYVVRYYPDDKYIIFDVDENGVLVKYNGTLAVVEIPEYVYPDDETTKILAIGSGAFSGNVTITSVTIPSSVVEIKSATSSNLGAFSGCTNLETIIYTANLVDIGDYAFSGCVKLESLKVEDTHTVSHIKSVGVDAFFNTAVSNMYLTNVESIGYRAFVQCANLDKVVIGNYEDITFKKSNGEMVAISEATDRLCNAPIYTNNADVIVYARSVGVECIIPSVTIGKWVAVVDGEGNDISEANRVVDTSDIIAIINENVSIIAKVTALNPRYVWKVDGVTQNTLTTKDITHTMSVAGKKEYKLVVIDEIGNEISSNTLNVTYYASIEEYEFIVEDGVLVTYNGSDTVVEVPSVVGSNTITTIGKDAFNGNANITQLILGDTIKTIESADTFVEGAFYGCSALTQVVSKGNALENIGNYAFYGVESLQLISATNLKTIGNYALYNAKNLEQIGSTAKMYNLMQVITLGINAIYANNKVESIYLDSLTTIGEYAIRSNTDLDIIYLGESVAFITYLNLQNAVVTENVSASATKTMLETISTANTKIYVYNNPELCKYFDVQAISYINTAITNLVYSDRVLVNTDSIFEVATTGLDVTYAWYKGDDDTAISAFDKVTINESVAGNYTYRLVVTDVVGNSIERELNVVIVENENELYFIVEDGVLVDYLGILTEVVVPTYKNGTDGEIWISVLGDAFKNNTKITKVVLGAGITEIMDDAFQGATSLNTVITTSSLTKVGNNVFNNLTKFELFTTDGSTNNFTNLTHIGDCAFANTKVDGVMLTNVESIGEGAFNGVESATIMVGNKDNIVITKSGAEAEDIATSNRMFTDKAIYSANPDLVQYASGKDITFTTLTVSISADKTLVAKDATVTISSITTGYGLSYTWYKDDVEIVNETSDTLLTTSSVVGTNKYKLKITDIMGGTCESDEVSVEYLINENYANFVVENGVLISYVGSATEVVVPDYLDVTNFDTAIHTISITAFRGNKNITSITFGANVRMVEGIEVLEDNSNINTAAFYGCTNLKEVEFLRLIDVIVGDYAFYNCGALESVVFDADSVVLGEYAFYNNTSLREVNSITDVTIDKYTFSGCVNLVQVGASSNVVKVANTTLPEYAFFRCEKVASFDLTQVEVIETCALNSCSGVTDLLLTNVTSIAANAIYINTSARVNIVINKDITSDGLTAGSIAGVRVTLYSTMDSYVKTFAETNRINFVGVNLTGYETEYVYPINSEHTLSVVGTGYGTLTYAWSKDGNLVQTSQSNELVISSTTAGVSTYRVMLTDSVGYTYTTEIQVTFVEDYYDVNASIGTNGENGVGGTIIATDSVEYLGSYDITITITGEYRLYSVELNGQAIDLSLFSVSGNVYTYTVQNVDKTQNIVATTKLLAYDVVVTGDSNVTLITSANMKVDSGNTAVIRFTLSEHYAIDEILVDGSAIDLDLVSYEDGSMMYTYAIDNVTKDMTVYISTTYASYSVTEDLTQGGTLSSSIAGNYVYGTTITVTPLASEHYNIKDVLINGVSVRLVNGSYSFSISEDTVVRVEFELQNMVLTVSITGGTIALNKVNVPYGTNGNVVFESTASAVYSVEIDGEKVTNLNDVVSYHNGQYTLRVDNVTKDMTVNIVMGLYINLTGVDNVTTTPNNIENKILVAYNTNQNIILNANENYVLTSVKVDNVEMLSSGVSRYVASFDRVVAEHSLDVVATRLYSVTASISNGTIASQNSTIQVQSGSDTTIVFSINENYSLSEIKINGEEIATKDNSDLTYDSNLQQYTLKLTNVTEDKNVVIVATLNKVKVNLVVGSNGSVKIGENTYTNESVELELDYGTNLTFVVKPNSEYEIDSIIYNGEAQNTTISAIANITNSENTLSVSFKLVKYIVQVTAGDNNVTLVSSASQEVNSGDDVNIEFRINNHYHYDSIKVNGVVYTGQVVNNAGVYSFTIAEVNKNQTIQIFSAIDTFSVGVATFTNGAVSPNSSVNVAYGNSQAFTFTPSTGYELLEENIVITNTDSDTKLTSGWTFVNNVLTISTIESDIEISVTMTKAKVYYNVNMVSNSIVTPINPISVTKVEEGTNYTFEFELKENYEVTSIQMNTTLFQGSIEENDGVYSFTYEINEDTVVTINTALVKHTVTVTVGDNGSVSPNTNVLVSHGSNQSFVITPDSGYDIDTILLNGVRQSVTGNTYSINNVTEDMTLSVTFKEKLAQYEISITLYNGTLVNGSQNKTTVTRGDNLVLNFKSESYYHLQSIVVDGENVSIDVAENDSLALSGGVYSYTFNNVTSNHTVSVTFKLNTVDIAINITGDGSVSPKVSGNVYTMDYGTSQSFTFIALAGYTLSSVNVDGVQETLSSDTTHTVSLDNVTENHTIDVVFTALPNVYVVNVSSNTTGGSITSGNGRNAVTSGDSLDIYVTVDKANEYIIESVNVDGINLDLNDNTIITDNGNGEYVIHILNVNSNKSVMVMFGLKKYAIDITYNANGVVYYSENVVASGNSVQATYTNNLTLQVYANEGYELLLSGITTGVAYNTGSGMYYTYSGNLITIYNVNSTASFVFNFTEKPVYYDVTVSSDSNVTIISDVDASILKNENLVVKFRVSDNYLVSTLLINNVAKNVEDYITYNAQDNTYTLSISVVENINVSIATELVKYDITITNDGNGVVHIGETAYNTNGVAKVSHGTNVNISVVPNADYEIATILLDGEEVEITNKQSQLVMIIACSGDHTLSVTYARVIVYYTVNVSSGLGGSVTNSGKNQVQENSEFSVTITPNENYELVSVLVDGVEIDIDTELEITGSSYVYTINNVSANVDIRATFAKVKYDVTINVGDNGSTSVNGTIYTGANNVLAVEYGTNLEFAFTASEGYRLNTFKVDGTNAELTNNTYTLTNVMVAHTIDITFEKVEYTITITGGENGSVETNRITVLHGEDADFDITPNEGYTVSGVYVDGVKDSANLENNDTYYTFKLDNVVASHSVEVVFTIKTLNISVSTTGEGSVDVSTIAVNYGSTKTIYIYPATNNHLLNVLDNGTSVIDIVELGLGGAYSYTISNIVVSHEISVVFELDKVEVNTTLNGQTASSTIDKLGSTEANYGSEFNLEIVVNNGYILQNVYVDGVAQDDLVDKLAGTYTLTIPSVTKDTNIEVVTIKDTYTVSVGSGVVIADGVNTVSYKGEKTIYVAVTNSTDLVTLTVDNVTLNANDVMFNSDESRYEYTITNITKDIAVVAETKASHNLYTFVVGEAGGITVAPKNGRNTVATGEDKVYKLTLSEDYHIYSIKVSDGQNATNVELNSLIATEDGYLLNIENITSNLDIVVTIATGSYKITIESGANGKTLPENEVGVSYPGESKIIVFYPDEYYTIDYVEIDGDQDNRLSISDLSTDAYGNYYYEFENIFANHTLKVEFKLVEYTITINTRGSGIGGTMTSTSTTITYGQTLDYDLVINEGYVLVKLLKDGVAQDGYNDLAHGNYEYTLSNVTSDVVFDLYFADSTYDISVSVNNGTMGSVNTGNTTTVGYGNDFTFEFTANDGYILKDVLLDSESVIDMVEDNKYILSNITESYNLEVIFEVKRTITINLNDSSAGYINVGTGEYDVVDGSTQNIGIFVNYGYMIESIVVDGENVDDIDSMLNTEDGGYYYTIASVTKDYVIDVTLVKTTYSVMVTKTSGGNVTPYSINAISVNYGHAVSFVMTPYTNYVLKSIVINGEDYTDLCTNDSGVYTYVITSVKQDYVVEISFATSVNNIVFNITGSGAVTPAPNGNVIEIPFNASKLVTFTADTDYVIGSLTIDGVTETNAIGKTEYYYSFTRVQEGHIVNVAFVPSKYSVDVTSNANGSTNKDGANEVDFNATLDIVITPDSGYVISEILVNTETYDLDELISSDEGLVLRLENINIDYVIEVSFDVSYTVELNANIESAVVIEGERVVLVGSSHEYVIRVNDGYMITNITIDSIAINPIEIYDATNDCYIVEFTNINENHVVDITLVQTGYGITITATDGGHTSEIGTVIVDYAGSKDVIITPDSHYHVTSVKLDGVEILQDLVLSDGAYTVTITNVVSDRTLDVKFELDSVHVELVINNTYGGYVIPSTSVTLKYGESQSYEINVYEDYVLAEVKINDTESVDLESIRLNLRKYQYNFGSVTSNQKIEITFAKAKYYMQNTASQGGSISASASVNYNEDYKCYITPNANYDILAVNVNGVDIDLNTLKVDEIGTYIEFNGVKQNYTIRASFTLQTFNISVNIENASCGNVDYASDTVVYGGSMAFNITANTDYIIASVKVDGVEQNNKNTYVFSNVTSDHTIDIVFAKSTYSILTYVISGVDSGYVTNPSTVSYGEDLVIMLYPSSHYVISALTINGKNIDDLSDITDRIVIENVDDDYILEITFAFTHYNITIEEVEGGSVVGDTTANPAESKRYVIEAQAGYTFSKLYVNDVEVVVSQDGDGYYYMLIDINSDYVIRAEFTKNTFTITFEMNNTAWGGILPAPANNIAVVEYGSDYTTIIRPREGYIVSKVLVDGVEYNATNNVVVLTDIVDNHTVSITFVINKKHTISTYQYTDHGSIIVNSEALVGQKVVFSVIPTEGYKVKSINLYDANGNDIAYDKNTYTFTMPNSTVNIRVEYEKIVVEDPGDEPGDDPVNPNPPVTPPTDPTPPPVAPPAESSVDVVMIVVIIIVAVLAVGAVVTIVVIVVIKKKNQPYFHSK